jgi:dipeptidyl aminopeptidase/acylaminoacyl peptidase
MNKMRKAVVCAFLLGIAALPAMPAKAPFTFEAMMRLSRVDDPQLSPDGKLVAFTVQTVDLAANSKPVQIYVVPSVGGVPVRLTSEGSMNTRPRWSPDSRRIFFISDRNVGPAPPGTTQVWSMNADGTDQRVMTSLLMGADGETVSPDGQLILFTSEVYPQCESKNAIPGVDFNEACNRDALLKENATKTKARSYTSLLYRHWTQYQPKTRRHILVETLNNSFKVRDLTPGDFNTPPFSMDGPDPYSFSPDSVQIAYVANVDSDLSTSTNSDIYMVPASGGAARKLTTNLGADEGPVFSPDGKSLAYRTQFRAGFESDAWRLAVIDLITGAISRPADELDRWVEEYTWSADSKRIFFTVEDGGTAPLLMVPALGGAIRTIAQGPTSVSSVQFSRDDRMMIYLEQSGSRPAEINMATSRGGAGVPLTHLNDSFFNDYELTPLDKFQSDGADGSKVESFIVKPPAFDPAQKYPVLILIHGGPQGEWGEQWSYRWNPQVFAAAGYVVVMPNPHGSVGYGQSFTDAVSGDWGGRAFNDIMAVCDNVSTLPYVDKDHMAAAGASYGGYMIDWILGHTDRFKALVSHAGVYDLRSEAGTTDELWFIKWEFKGFPWQNATNYDRWSPNAYVGSFRTPTLVTQGEIDYRVPIGQSQELFTALQQNKIPSKLVLFPDEGHWIQKPQNSQYWYSTVIDWINRYTKTTPVKATK